MACRIAVLRVKVQTWRTQYRFPTRFFPKLGFEVLVTETEELDWLLNEINIVWACVAACLYVCLWAGVRSSIRTRSEKPRISYIQNHLLLFGSFRAGWIFWPLKGIDKKLHYNQTSNLLLARSLYPIKNPCFWSVPQNLLPTCVESNSWF